jgi:hypothetical protein
MSTHTATRRTKQDAADSNGAGPGAPQPAVNGKPDAKPAKDPRVAALWRFATSITIFTVVGAFFLHFEDAYAQPLVALAVAYPLELGLETLEAYSCGRPAKYRGGRKQLVEFLLPAHITALSIALLLYPAERLGYVVFAVVVAVCSKSILTVRCKGKKKHFLNPSNLGIAVTLVLFPSVGVSPAYQFTENVAHNPLAWIIPLFVVGSGTAINAQLTKKWPLILGWLGGFVLQAVLRSAIFGTPLVAPLLPLTGLVFWLYTNYMITDPGTTPMKPRNQAVFGASVATAYGVLVIVHVAYGLFFALTIVCALRGLVLAAPEWQAALRARMRPGPARAGDPAGEAVTS